MAAGTISDVKLYQAQFQTGLFETVSQDVNKFNEASAGTILLSTEFHRGNFLQEAFFTIGDTMRTRVLSSTADVSDSKLTQEEFVSPKISWADGPIADTLDQFKKIGDTPEVMSYVLGQQAGAKLAKKMLNSAIAALKGLFFASDSAFGAVRYDTTALSPPADLINYTNLIRATALLGDRAQSISAWLMDSASYYKLMEGALSVTIDSVAGVTIAQGSVATLGKPVIITDSDYLRVEANSIANDSSLIFGLVNSAVRVTVSEDTDYFFGPISGKQNLVNRYQSEGAYTIRVKGSKWSTSTANPSEAALATKTNWTKAATSVKDGPGVLLLSQGNFVSTK